MTAALNSDDVFVAEDEGPPRRRFWIYRDPPSNSLNETRGWQFVFDQADEQGEWGVGWDSWEEWFFEIMRYPPEYSSRPLVWRRESNDEVVELATLQPFYDGKIVLSTETPESAGLRGV